MNSLSLITLILFFSQSLFAGGAPVSLSCVSKSGRTHVSSLFPGDYPGSKLTFTIDNEEVIYRDQFSEDLQYDDSLSANAVFVIEDYQRVLEMSVFDLIAFLDIKDQVKIFELKSIKNSFQSIETQYGKKKKFTAIVTGIDPRKEKKGDLSPEIYVNCVYDYEI